MLLFRHYQDLPATAQGAVVAIGNFDGLHPGHYAVLRQARALATQLAAPLGVLSFEPHPRTVFQQDDRPFRLTPFREKAHLLEQAGLDILYPLHFDMAFSQLSAADFIMDVLVRGLKVKGVVVGHDYRFGNKRMGDIQALESASRTHGFAFQSVPALIAPLAADPSKYSSTQIRHAIRHGDPRKAAHILGRYWEVEGRVEHGDARARHLGFPTANIALADYVCPAKGVYAVKATQDKSADATWIDGIANYGLRPTFNKEHPILEVHLLDYDGDLYGQYLRVAFTDFIRPEIKFDSFADLQAQIPIDIAKARQSHAHDSDFRITIAKI